MARKRHQTSLKMNQRLDTIWKSGDRDEGSIKHIIYGILSLFAGKSWSEGKDYRMAEDRKSSFGVPFGAKPREKWGKIETIRDELGIADFRSLISETKFGSTIAIYDDED